MYSWVQSGTDKTSSNIIMDKLQSQIQKYYSLPQDFLWVWAQRSWKTPNLKKFTADLKSKSRMALLGFSVIVSSPQDITERHVHVSLCWQLVVLATIYSSCAKVCSPIHHTAKRRKLEMCPCSPLFSPFLLHYSISKVPSMRGWTL